jgi:putative spermidine/putrescine transport system ATP-binding protein
MPGIILELDRVTKRFGATIAADALSLTVQTGEFFTFLGPSGSGKSTLLRMVAGLEKPDGGTIRIDGQDVAAIAPWHRNLGMMFQNYAVFPHMNVRLNVGYGLKARRLTQREIKRRVDAMLDLVGLVSLGDKNVTLLSGGEQQRVALARALAPEPRMLLLDEPLSALDAKIRISLRQDIRALQRELGITSIFVTHDQEEALSISDRIVVMNEGRVEQVGTSSEIYNYPRTRFVASFVGTLNILSGHVVDPASGKMAVDGQELVTTQQLAPDDAGKKRLLALRPEAIVLEAPAAGRNTLAATVEEVNFLGAVVRIRTRVKDAVISLDVFNDPNRRLPERGQPVALGFSHENLLVLEEGAA